MRSTNNKKREKTVPQDASGTDPAIETEKPIPKKKGTTAKDKPEVQTVQVDVERGFVTPDRPINRGSGFAASSNSSFVSTNSVGSTAGVAVAAGLLTNSHIASPATALALKQRAESQRSLFAPRGTSASNSSSLKKPPAAMKLSDFGFDVPPEDNDGKLRCCVIQAPNNMISLLFRCEPNDRNSQKFHSEKVS